MEDGMADSSGDIRPKLDDIRRDLQALRADLDGLRVAGMSMASNQLREQPLQSLAIAFGAGVLIGLLKA
jgi:ElaB/YqjD/DUF883 family membrane-anchored ribosome-binding protein